MLLAIDVGNTETVLGLFDDDRHDVTGDPQRGLRHHWRISTVVARTPDEYATMLHQLLGLADLSLDETVTALAISSSSPGATTQLRRMVERWFAAIPVTVMGPGTKSGMSILYDSPRDVGADRIADAVGAYDLYPGALIVVDMGTATVFDVVNAEGAYLGGAIAPGVAISLEALYTHASGLRSVELLPPRSVIGRTTAESIQSGVLYGYGAQIDGMVARIQAELGAATVIATGGLASVIAPYATAINHVEPWLTLHGLRIVHERNHSRS